MVGLLGGNVAFFSIIVIVFLFFDILSCFLRDASVYKWL